MKKNILPLKDLQEVVLWQKLNNQRITLLHRGKAIPDKSFQNLKEFCFKNRLFAKVNETPLLLEIPLSLITDFKDTFFLTLSSKSWTNLIISLIPNTYCLNVENALADGLEAIKKYQEKYEHQIESIDDTEEDNDFELYAFIDKYLTEKDSVGIDIRSLSIGSHRLKLNAIKKIIKTIDYKIHLIRMDDRLYIDIRKDELVNNINSIYKDTFCIKADPHRSGSVVAWAIKLQSIQKLLSDKQKERNLKQSIKEFIKHELPVCKKEYTLLMKFSKDIRNFTNTRLTSKIAICETSPFSFLKNPLPII